MKRHFNFHRLNRCGALALMVAICALVSAAAADDWPLVRRDTLGSGVAAQPLPQELDVAWTYRAGDDAGFDATAVVADGMVYVGDNAGTFHAIRLADGKPVWTKAFDDASFGAGAAVDKDRLFVGDLSGSVRCLSRDDGEELWSIDVGSEIYAGLTLVGDNLLTATEAGELICHNAADGKERWHFTIDAPLRCTPTVSSRRVMLAGCDARLHFVDITSGAEVATVDIDGPTGATAAMSDGRAYFGTEGGTFYAIDCSADQGDPPAVAWNYRDPRRGQPIRAAAAVAKELIVYGSHGKAVYALDPATGEPKWPQPLPTRARIESSPVIAGDRVVAATAAGVLYVLDASTGEPKWQYDAGGSFTASPAVVDRHIILGNGDGTLYCFGPSSSEPANESPPNGETTEREGGTR